MPGLVVGRAPHTELAVPCTTSDREQPPIVDQNPTVVVVEQQTFSRSSLGRSCGSQGEERSPWPGVNGVSEKWGIYQEGHVVVLGGEVELC